MLKVSDSHGKGRMSSEGNQSTTARLALLKGKKQQCWTRRDSLKGLHYPLDEEIDIINSIFLKRPTKHNEEFNSGNSISESLVKLRRLKIVKFMEEPEVCFSQEQRFPPLRCYWDMQHELCDRRTQRHMATYILLIVLGLGFNLIQTGKSCNIIEGHSGNFCIKYDHFLDFVSLRSIYCFTTPTIFIAVLFTLTASNHF